MTTTEIIPEIDYEHTLSNRFLKNKDSFLYTAMFAENLEYTQQNGKTIGKKQITKDTQKYFDRIIEADSSYERIDSEFKNEIFIERLIQKSEITIRVFLFFSKKWKLEREGIYHWQQIGAEWKIIKVQVLSEIIKT
jgi:hypothetical protein